MLVTHINKIAADLVARHTAQTDRYYIFNTHLDRTTSRDDASKPPTLELKDTGEQISAAKKERFIACPVECMETAGPSRNPDLFDQSCYRAQVLKLSTRDSRITKSLVIQALQSVLRGNSVQLIRNSILARPLLHPKTD